MTTDAEKLATLLACKTLATRAATTGIDIVLHRDDLALLERYESLGDVSDQLRHAAHLLRSDMAILDGLIVRRNMRADPEGTIERIKQHFRID